MDKTKITLYLPKETAHKFKVFCAETGMAYGEWVEKWLTEEVGREADAMPGENPITQDTSGEAMLELDDEMYNKGWFLTVERGVYGGPENFRAAYENRGTGNVSFAFAPKEPLARALAAYRADADTIAKKELEGLKGMMAVADPQTRAEYLSKWFLCPAAKAIGEDPTRRGEFARDAGMTEEELGEWNKSLAGK